MKMLLVALALAGGSAAVAQSNHYVSGYTRSNGTYVPPHMQTNPNGSMMDNYSTRGNVNPYTGQVGTVDPYATQRSNYGTNPAPRRPTGGW